MYRYFNYRFYQAVDEATRLENSGRQIGDPMGDVTNTRYGLKASVCTYTVRSGQGAFEGSHLWGAELNPLFLSSALDGLAPHDKMVERV